MKLKLDLRFVLPLFLIFLFITLGVGYWFFYQKAGKGEAISVESQLSRLQIKDVNKQELADYLNEINFFKEFYYKPEGGERLNKLYQGEVEKVEIKLVSQPQPLNQRYENNDRNKRLTYSNDLKLNNKKAIISLMVNEDYFLNSKNWTAGQITEFINFKLYYVLIGSRMGHDKSVRVEIKNEIGQGARNLLKEKGNLIILEKK